MKQSILQVLRYFDQFQYPPTIDEVHTFLSKKISKRELLKELNRLVSSEHIVKKDQRVGLNETLFKVYAKKKHYSERIIKLANQYLSLLSIIPAIQFIGFSGSTSMKNMSREGDIDLFVIASPNTIWTVRFMILVYKKLLSVLNSEIGTKLCLNLIFSEDGLEIEKEKQNEYIAHEVLQLKPVINKNQTYELFLTKNKWIQLLFPNVQINSSKQMNSKMPSGQSGIREYADRILQKFQTFWLKQKGYKWVEKRGQLWLIQEDYEEQINTKTK